MPEVPLGGSNVIKPASMNLKMGDRATFEIQAQHHITPEGYVNIPVRAVDGSGSGDFPLNVTNRRALAEKLGSNSDTWKPTRFTAVVVPQRNPETGQQVLSWSIEKESISTQNRLQSQSQGAPEKSYDCPVCHDPFLTAKDLATHLATH